MLNFTDGQRLTLPIIFLSATGLVVDAEDKGMEAVRKITDEKQLSNL